MDNQESRGFRVRDLRGQPQEEKIPEIKPEEPKAVREPRGEAHTGPIDFPTFIMSLSTSALIHMGAVEDPHGSKEEKNFELARQEIDIISMLEEKTRGNLNAQEKQFMEEVVYELRVRFVEATKGKK